MKIMLSIFSVLKIMLGQFSVTLNPKKLRMTQFLPFGGFASNFVFTDAYLVLRTSLVLGDLVLRTSLVLGDLVLRMSLVLGDLVLRTYLVLGMLQCQEQHVFKYVFIAKNAHHESILNLFVSMHEIIL